MRVRRVIRAVATKILNLFGYVVVGEPGKQFFVGKKKDVRPGTGKS
jgi:hypothetical protein